VVVSAEFGAGESFQNHAESSRRDVKAARLNPYAFGIRNPEAIVLLVDVGNEVSAAPLLRVEPVGETIEGIDGHISLSFQLTNRDIDLTSIRPQKPAIKCR
jgi:hypothetical protein